MIVDATSTDQLEQILAQPGPIWVLKHSLTCGISLEAHAQVEQYAASHPQQPIVVVAVQTSRPLSNWISSRFATSHQSPQLFLVRNGRVRWTTSHWQITDAAMATAAATSADA
jgi:bacillithiol system protein YtxJ